MARALVTGMSAVGKSTSLAELASRGHTVVDADEDGYTEETIVEPLLRQSATACPSLSAHWCVRLS